MQITAVIDPGKLLSCFALAVAAGCATSYDSPIPESVPDSSQTDHQPVGGTATEMARRERIPSPVLMTVYAFPCSGEPWAWQ